MTAASYRVLCGDLIDRTTGAPATTIREELPIHDLKWSEVLNAPGAASGWISMDDAKCTRTNLDPGATAIYIERGGLLVWGGILWTARPNQDSRRLDLGCEGFWSYFRRRLIRATKTYAQQDQLAIARDLLTYAQAQPGGNIGVTIGSETSGVLRDRTYAQYERKNLGEAIEQLAAVEQGFDFQIAVAWSGNTPTKTFTLYYPRRGGRIDGLIFAPNVPGGVGVEVDVDAKAASNQVDTLGAGDGDTMLIATRADTTLLTRYPLLEEALSYRDVSVQATLQGHADAQVGRRKYPPELPKVTMLTDAMPALGTYQIGDEGTVRAADGWISIDGYYRVQAKEVAAPDSGPETVDVTFASADTQVF